MGELRKKVWIFAAVVLVLAGGSTAYAVRQSVMQAQACGIVQAQIAEIGLVRTVTMGSGSVVVLGDSYSVGSGLTDRTKAWPALVGKAEGWTTQVAGVGGTGFVNEGPCGGQSFGNRLGLAMSQSPETLIIAGGINDSESDPAAVGSAANALLGQVASISSVVLVGPSNAPAKKNIPAIDHALAEAAAANGREYVSALTWDLDYQPDGLHPTEAGHQAYARHIGQALQP
jgi:lysophospholipase L1-like esterase